MVDFVRRLALEINQRGFEGAVAECGVSRGWFAMYINKFFPDRKCYLFDSFTGFRQQDIDAEKHEAAKKWVVCQGQERYGHTNMKIVMQRMPYPEKVIVKPGFVPETFAGLEDERFVFVNLDMDLYAPHLAALRYFAPKMTMGGVILVHDYYPEILPGVKQAVDEFAKECSFTVLPIGDNLSIALVIRN